MSYISVGVKVNVVNRKVVIFKIFKFSERLFFLKNNVIEFIDYSEFFY